MSKDGMTDLAKKWLDEYYPIGADKTHLSEAFSHSVKKWEGARPEILKKYELVLEGMSVRDSGYTYVMDYKAYTCALCFHYARQEDEYDEDNNDTYISPCVDCPLYRYLGKECYMGRASPYKVFAYEGNPIPMINALKKAQEEFNLRKERVEQ